MAFKKKNLEEVVHVRKNNQISFESDKLFTSYYLVGKYQLKPENRVF